MTFPLLMLGPGGDYQTRYDIKGKRLVKSKATRQSAQSQGHDPNGETSGSAAYFKLPGRADAEDNLRDNLQSERAASLAPIRIADRFDHTQPAGHATYARPGRESLNQKLATLDAVSHWMNAQDQLLDELVAEHQVLSQGVDRASQALPQIRIIRWNGGTLAMKAKAKAKQTETLEQPQPQALTTSLSEDTRKDTSYDIQLTTPNAEPYAQADGDSHDDPRHPAIAGLFPNDEGTGPSLGRLQGHRFRTRRSAHQKGMPHTRPQQGALFGAVA